MPHLCKPVCKPKKQMSETIKVLCYKSKTLSNGEHPLMLCVCKDRKRKFQSLGLSIKAEQWDFKTNQPKAKCPNRERIILLINEIQKVVLDKRIAGKDFTATTLILSPLPKTQQIKRWVNTILHTSKI